MARPDKKPTWATDHTTQPEETATGDSGYDVIEPGATKQGDGWNWKEAPPYQWVNWLFKLIGEWITWIESKLDTHTHDGEGGDNSAPKVAFPNTVSGEEHLDFGANGIVEVVEDEDDAGTDIHRIRHRHTGDGEAITEADTLQANGEGLRLANEYGNARLFIDSGTLGFRSVRLRGDDDREAGLEVSALAPTLAEPDDSVMAAKWPRDGALYLANLVKATISFWVYERDDQGYTKIDWDQTFNGTVGSGDALESHDGDTWKIGLIQFDNVLGSITTGMGFKISSDDSELNYNVGDGEPNPTLWSIQARWDPDEGTFGAILIRIFYWSGSDWLNIKRAFSDSEIVPEGLTQKFTINVV